MSNIDRLDTFEVACDIYLPNEWNIPQLNMLGCISARYRNVDVQEFYEKK